MKTRAYQNKTTESAERDPVQVYKAYKDKRLENMLKTAWKLKFRGRFWTFYIQGMNFSSFQAMEPKNEPS